MNQRAEVVVDGNAGTGVAENMMSGSVWVKGNASQSAGATAHGGLLVVEGNAAARCGISMKGVDIVVGGNVGHMSAFMAQAGRLVDPRRRRRGAGRLDLRGAHLRARRGRIARRRLYCEGDARRTPSRNSDDLLKAAGFEDDDTSAYTRYGSARSLYHFHVDNAAGY